jgi:hypothetical protein
MKYVTGIAELDRELYRLESRQVARIAKSGVVDGLAVIADRIRTYSPPGKRGTVGQSIGKRLVASRNSGEVGGKAGVNVAKQVANGRTFNGAPHAHLVAFGTGARWTDRGAYRGAMPGNDFVLRAWQSARFAAVQAVEARTYRMIAG